MRVRNILRKWPRIFHGRWLDDHPGAHTVHQHWSAPSGGTTPGTGLRSRSLAGRMQGPAGTVLRPLLSAVHFTVHNVGEDGDNNGGDGFCLVRFPPSSPPPWAGLAPLSDPLSANAAAFLRKPLVMTRRANAPITLTCTSHTNKLCCPSTSGSDEPVAAHCMKRDVRGLAEMPGSDFGQPFFPCPSKESHGKGRVLPRFVQ
jgi:hypothetical protein